MSADWPIVALGDVLRRSEHIIPLDPDATYREVTVRINGKGVVERRQVQGVEIAADRRYQAKAGQFIISRIDARHGASGLIPDDLDGAVVTNDFPLFDVAKDRLDAAFLGWMSKTASFVELCKRASEGTTNRVRLSEDRFKALNISLPPLDEQRWIVARIEELAAKVKEARRLRSLAFDEADALSRSATDSIYRRLTSEIGPSRLAAACTSITDGDHLTPAFSKGGVKFIFVGNVSTGRLHFNGVKYVTAQYFQGLSATRVPRRDDLLYSAVGATLGIPAVVDVDDDFCFQRHVAILKPDHAKILSRFLWHMLKSQTVFDKAWASTTGSAQPTIPLRAIRELPIPMPPLDRQKQVVAELDALQAKVDAVRALQTETAVELDAMVPAILDKAFKGGL
ncbi:MAG: restriction endonuclease subunit S [Alphaproteobacteria bacterium]|nr:restriction endonuclease subunit S [Alphaproteobacteria bacterium]MDE2495206.1 restriction endonuclease subunit S [Alphaproteobacteria bacterium]